jgi:hypothetical protein
MLIYGFILTHLWIVFGVVLYVGYLTYADYYDKFNKKFIKDFKEFTIIAFGVVGVLFVITGFDKGFNIEMYLNLCKMFGVTLSLNMILLFCLNASILRQYFGRKRNKV